MFTSVQDSDCTILTCVCVTLQTCIMTAKDWEKRLENQSRLWRVLQQKHEAAEAWLAQAEAVLSDGADDPDSLIRKHKKFFNRVDNKLLDEHQAAAQEILGHLEPREQDDLQHNMAALEDHWKVGIGHSTIDTQWLHCWGQV